MTIPGTFDGFGRPLVEVDALGRAMGHPNFGVEPHLGYPPDMLAAWGWTETPAALQALAGGWEQLPGPAKAYDPQVGTIPRVGGAGPLPMVEGANPGLPGVFQGQAPAVGRHPSWQQGAEGLTDQLKPFAARDKMAPNIHYYQSPNKIKFEALTDPDFPDVVARAVIRPPLLDMRPDLRDVGMGNRPQISVPIWREAAYGQGLYLFIRIHGPIPDITADTIRVFNIAQGDIFNENLVTALQDPEEITQEFMDGADGVILSWPTPLYRFWRVNLRIDQIAGTVPGDIGPERGLAYSIGVY